MDRFNVLCFGGTYTLALVVDLARVAVRGATRWWLTLGLTVLAWLVQTAYLGNLAWQRHQLPVASAFESLLVLSWVLAGVTLYLIVRSPRGVAVGVFVLPVVVALVAVAGFGASREDWVRAGWGPSARFWGVAHGLLWTVGAVGSCVGFAAGLMYLAQARRLKRKRPTQRGFVLPSLESSERLNRVAITASFPFLTAGLVVGLIMDLALGSSGHAPMSWADPKVITGIAMWLALAAALHARSRPELQGRRVMLLTVLAFACLVATTIGVDLLHLTEHGRPRDHASTATSAGGRP